MLHFRRAVCAAEIFERVDTLAVFAVVSGRRCDDLRLALDARADFSDLRQQCIRIFAGHAQLLGLKDKHAVFNAVQFADALLHLRRAVCTADILKRINALDAVAPCGVLVMMVVMLVLVVVTAAAVVAIFVMVMMFVLMLVRFFYFLCVRSGFFLLLFCHCCRLLIRNNI